MKRLVIAASTVGALLLGGLAYANISTPLGEIHRLVLGIRNHPDGFFHSQSGHPVYLGTIDATTTSKTNHQATTPFNNTGGALCGKLLLIQNAGSVAVRLHAVTTTTGTTTNTRGTGFGPEIQSKERVIVFMDDTRCYMAGIALSSTANIDFWELQ